MLNRATARRRPAAVAAIPTDHDPLRQVTGDPGANPGAKLPVDFLDRWLRACVVPRYAGTWRQPAGWRSRRGARNDYSLALCLAGSLSVRAGGRVLRVGPGGLIIVPPGLPFEDGDGGDGRGTTLFAAGCLMTTADGIDPLTLLHLPQAVVLPQDIDAAAQAEALAVFHRPGALMAPRDRVLARGRFDVLLAGFLLAGQAAGAFPHLADRPLPTRLWTVLDTIDRSLVAPAGIRGLAAKVGISPEHLTREFRRHLGCSPKQWLTRRRMAQAAAILVGEADVAIADVARRVGYADPFRFSRVFSATHGMPPRRWRAAHLVPDTEPS